MGTITMSTKAFTGSPRGEYRVDVDEQGVVRVYDPVAGHFTVAHAMTEREQRRARALAAKDMRRFCPKTKF